VGINVGTDLGDEKEFYRHYFLLKNNRKRDDYEPMIRLAQAFSKRNEEFEQATQQVIDVDEWLRAFAALSLSGANDNYNAGSQHNAQFYQRPSDGKMLLLPFDMDFAFHLSATAPIASNGDLRKLIRIPNNEHAFLGHLNDIIETSFNSEYMDRWVDHYNDLLPGQNISGISSWIRQREAFVKGQFPDEVGFAITSPDQTVSGTTVTLEGTGWINVRALRLAGSDRPVLLNWTDPTHWQAAVPLRAGSQQLNLEAFDFAGNLISSDSVIVTTTAGDYNLDGLVNAADIDLLCREVRSGDHGAMFDLDGDGLVDLNDFEALVAGLLRTSAGDSNLDGIFNSADLVAVFRAAKYEDAVPLNTGWAEGDWNCDGDFTTRDLVDAFISGGYIAAARKANFVNMAAAIDDVMSIDTQHGDERFSKNLMEKSSNLNQKGIYRALEFSLQTASAPLND
jgi:hypothetical protein